MNALAGAVELSVAVWRTAAVVAWLAGALVRPAPPLPADGWLRRADGARAAVVLLHGVNQNGWVWRQKARHLAASLPADADVFAPLLDHGEPTSANAGRVADAVRAWRAAHPGARVVVAGFSNGGRLALWLARDAHVDNVVLVAAPIGGARWVELLPPWLLRWKISAKLEEELRTHHWTARGVGQPAAGRDRVRRRLGRRRVAARARGVPRHGPARPRRAHALFDPVRRRGRGRGPPRNTITTFY